MSISADKIIETRHIKLPKGEVLTIEMTQPFIDRVRQHFGLIEAQQLDDDYVRMYVWGAVNTAVDRAEWEINKDESK